MPNSDASRLLIACTVALFCMALTVSIRANEIINGLVADAHHLPLDGVEVGFQGEAVKTKADGRFQWVVSESHAEAFPLTFRKVGYEPKTVTVETSTMPGTGLQVEMAPAVHPQDTSTMLPSLRSQCSIPSRSKRANP